MKILLHICCAPCALYPWQKLTGENGFEAAGFFYNPNIHPAAEYAARKDSVARLFKELEGKIYYGEYDIERFFHAVHGRETAGKRCRFCWELRLIETARFARRNGFQAFTTTLFVSPYQDVQKIREIGGKAGTAEGVEFYFEDFRPGFKSAHESARKKGYHLQKYCGCLFSERDRMEKKVKGIR